MQLYPDVIQQYLDFAEQQKLGIVVPECEGPPNERIQELSKKRTRHTIDLML